MGFTPTAKLRSLPGLRHCSSPRHKHGSRALTGRERDTAPASNDAFCVSGRASFLNLRTITSELVLKEKFKQNKMRTMAGKHSEILSEETECWPEAVAQSSNDCETRQTSPDWQHSRRPWQLSSSGAHLHRALLSRESGTEEQQPAGLFPRGSPKASAGHPHPEPSGVGPALRHREASPASPPCPQAGQSPALRSEKQRGRGCFLSLCHPFSQPPALSALPLPFPLPPRQPWETCAPRAAGVETGLGQRHHRPGCPTPPSGSQQS